MADITDNVGIGLDIRHLASGTDVIGVFPSGTFLIVEDQTTPIDNSKNNPEYTFEWNGFNQIGSIIQFIGAGSFVQVFSWESFSGTTAGTGSRISNIGSWI